jgi:hypothetical protein
LHHEQIPQELGWLITASSPPTLLQPPLKHSNGQIPKMPPGLTLLLPHAQLGNAIMGKHNDNTACCAIWCAPTKLPPEVWVNNSGSFFVHTQLWLIVSSNHTLAALMGESQQEGM